LLRVLFRRTLAGHQVGRWITENRWRYKYAFCVSPKIMFMQANADEGFPRTTGGFGKSKGPEVTFSRGRAKTKSSLNWKFR